MMLLLGNDEGVGGIVVGGFERVSWKGICYF